MKKPDINGAEIEATECNIPVLNPAQKEHPVIVIIVARYCGVKIATNAQYVI